MSNYNFRIGTLHFTVGEDSFTLQIIINGESFPTPVNTNGTISGSEITFDLDGGGTTTNSATFNFSTSNVLPSYTFKFINIPSDLVVGDLVGTISTDFQAVDDFFDIQDCKFEEEESEIGDQAVGSKKGRIKVVKKPGVMQDYQCVDVSLNPANTAIVMTFLESSEDDLEGSINNIDSNLFTSGLTIQTSVRDGNPEPDSVGLVAMTD